MNIARQKASPKQIYALAEAPKVPKPKKREKHQNELVHFGVSPSF